MCTEFYLLCRLEVKSLKESNKNQKLIVVLRLKIVQVIQALARKSHKAIKLSEYFRIIYNLFFVDKGCLIIISYVDIDERKLLIKGNCN